MTAHRTVTLIVWFIGVLAFVLYGAAISLLHASKEVPDALWLAAGNVSGALCALLSSTRSTTANDEGGVATTVTTGTEPTTVTVTSDASVPPVVTVAPELEGEDTHLGRKK